jgi:hypothetical protein
MSLLILRQSQHPGGERREDRARRALRLAVESRGDHALATGQTRQHPTPMVDD